MRKSDLDRRLGMVETQIQARGVRDERVLNAMRRVPRHRFVPEDMRRHAYNDEPLPVGQGQTISQPYIVAYMTETLCLDPQDRILEIGTGSGYQTAVLAELVRQVYTVEILPELSLRAREVLTNLGYTNITYRTGDGSQGWEEHAPFDGIMATAAPDKVPEALQQQLEVGGRLIIPVGVIYQDLLQITRDEKKFKKEKLIPVRFVPLLNLS